jgi:hypothetical protein
MVMIFCLIAILKFGLLKYIIISKHSSLPVNDMTHTFGVAIIMKQVNASPSLTANTPEDYALKMRLLHDTMTIVDLDGRYDSHLSIGATIHAH